MNECKIINSVVFVSYLLLAVLSSRTYKRIYDGCGVVGFRGYRPTPKTASIC